MSAVDIEIGQDGKIVMIEPPLRKGLVRRVFRRMVSGDLEYCTFEDWRDHNTRARFYGFASKELPSSMVCK